MAHSTPTSLICSLLLHFSISEISASGKSSLKYLRKHLQMAFYGDGFYARNYGNRDSHCTCFLHKIKKLPIVKKHLVSPHNRLLHQFYLSVFANLLLNLAIPCVFPDIRPPQCKNRVCIKFPLFRANISLCSNH